MAETFSGEPDIKTKGMGEMGNEMQTGRKGKKRWRPRLKRFLLHGGLGVAHGVARRLAVGGWVLGLDAGAEVEE